MDFKSKQLPQSQQPQNVEQKNLNFQNNVSVKKIFIERDYSEGTDIRFKTIYPKEFTEDPAIKNRIDSETFVKFIEKLNSMYAEAERMSTKVCMESCIACITAYLTYLCFDTYFDKCLKKIAAFIDEQNDIVFHPLGIHITDPIERGLRVIEITIVINTNNVNNNNNNDKVNNDTRTAVK